MVQGRDVGVTVLKTGEIQMERRLYCEDNGTGGQGPQGRQGLHPSLTKYVRIRRTDPNYNGNKMFCVDTISPLSHTFFYLWGIILGE